MSNQKKQVVNQKTATPVATMTEQAKKQADIITVDNIYSIAHGIAIKAVKTVKDNMTIPKEKRAVKTEYTVKLHYKNTSGKSGFAVIQIPHKTATDILNKTGNNLTSTASPLIADYVQEVNKAELLDKKKKAYTKRADKTSYKDGAYEFIERLYKELKNDIRNIKPVTETKYKQNGERAIDWLNNTSIGDGYDLVQEVVLVLWQNVGKSLHDTILSIAIDTIEQFITNSIVDKKGNDVTVLKAAFKSVNKYIIGQRQKFYKVHYIDDLKGGYIESRKAVGFNEYLPGFYDDLESYEYMDKTLKELDLTERQEQVIDYVMDGRGIREIARILDVTHVAIGKSIKQIKVKFAKAGLTYEKYKELKVAYYEDKAAEQAERLIPTVDETLKPIYSPKQAAKNTDINKTAAQNGYKLVDDGFNLYYIKKPVKA